MIVETEAIVLNSMKYGDTSKIVSLFTRSFGKISVIAKGARKPKNKFGSSLDPLSYSYLSFYNNPNKELKVLANSEHHIPLRKIPESFEHLSAGLIIAEAITQTIDIHEVNEELFNLASTILIELNNRTSNPYNLSAYFQINYLRILGFAINLNDFDPKSTEYFFSFQFGSFVKYNTQMNLGYKFDKESAEKLWEINNAELEDVTNIECSKQCIKHLNDFFVRYFSYHLDKKFSYKTLNLFNSIL